MVEPLTRTQNTGVVGVLLMERIKILVWSIVGRGYT